MKSQQSKTFSQYFDKSRTDIQLSTKITAGLSIVMSRPSIFSCFCYIEKTSFHDVGKVGFYNPKKPGKG